MRPQTGVQFRPSSLPSPPHPSPPLSLSLSFSLSVSPFLPMTKSPGIRVDSLDILAISSHDSLGFWKLWN